MAEPDPEIQELLERSAGLNVGIDLPGSCHWVPLLARASQRSLPRTSSGSTPFLTNVDRTPRNPNLLLWHRQLWLIDHGATIYTQHGWSGDLEAIATSAAARSQSSGIMCCCRLQARSARRTCACTASDFGSVGGRRRGSDALLDGTLPFSSPERHREAYATHLAGRLVGPRTRVDEAEEARHAGA